MKGSADEDADILQVHLYQKYCWKSDLERRLQIRIAKLARVTCPRLGPEPETTAELRTYQRKVVPVKGPSP